MNHFLTWVLVGLGAAVSTQAISADYPFKLPDNVKATININTSEQEAYNNLLLGTNQFGFRTAKDRELMRIFNPITVRFPHGLWANWYDWRTDGTRVFGTDTFKFTTEAGHIRTQTLDHLANIKQMDKMNLKVGIDGLEQLNAEKIRTNEGKGFDMMWTFNMSADGKDFTNGSPDTIAHYKDLKSRGFEVNAIEMGNENFYPGQRSSIIPMPADYIKRAKSMSKALKNLDPNIKLSVPLLRRGSSPNPSWNKNLTEDQSYFDAVTVHTYVGKDPDQSSGPDGSFGTALTARHHLANSVNNYARKVAPNKPIWLTEWGVKSGGANAVSVLGMADAYIFMSQNQGIYERANFFSVNGKLNSFLVWDGNKIKYPLQKTAVGSSYEIIRGVFEDSTLLGSWMSSPDLIKGVNAVSGRAVVKDGNTIVFVLNLTDKTVPFTVKLDGSVFNGNFYHRALTFNSMGEQRVMEITKDPLKIIKEGKGDIILPKFSMSRIELKDSDIEPADIKVSMTAPTDDSEFELGETITLKANASTTNNDIQKVNFLVNGALYKQVTTAPYEADWKPLQAGDYSVHAIAFKEDGSKAAAESRTVIIKSKVEEPITPNVTVAMTSPADNSEFTLGKTIPLTANATGSDIKQVNLLVNGRFLKQTNVAPYTTKWTPVAAGTYAVHAIAITNKGDRISATSRTVIINDPPVVIPPEVEVPEVEVPEVEVPEVEVPEVDAPEVETPDTDVTTSKPATSNNANNLTGSVNPLVCFLLLISFIGLRRR